jgi:hypothetical protein
LSGNNLYIVESSAGDRRLQLREGVTITPVSTCVTSEKIDFSTRNPTETKYKKG